MTLLQIFEIERDVAENPPLPPQGNKIQSHEVHEFYDYHDWKLRVQR